MGSLDWVTTGGGVGNDIATDIGVSPSEESSFADIQILRYHLDRISMLASVIRTHLSLRPIRQETCYL